MPNLGIASVLRHFLLPALFVMAFAFSARAQEATIVGTVTDPSNAPIPNASVTVLDVDTNLPRHFVTSGEGQYVAPDLPIGHYSIRVEAPGFKVAEQKGVALSVGDRARADFKLEIGSTQETINVEATPVAVQSDTGEVSDVIGGQQLAQLATNGRSIYTLTQLVPGASGNMADFQNPTPVGGDSSVSFNGERQSHNIYLIDGGEDLDRGGSGNISVLPSIDAVAEFRVLTSNYSPEYGLSSAGTTTLVFKSGTSQFHASLWEFNRNDAFDAGNYFTNAAGGKSPELRFNTYGFNVGGPVIIPKVYHPSNNRTFFFYNMEWRKLVQGGLVNQTVPPTGEYGGAFNTAIHVPNASQLSPAQLQTYANLGLQPGQAFPNNTIPASLLDPNAQLLLKAGIFPASNNGNQFVGGNKLPTDVREEIVRIDHQFSDKFWIFGHYVAEQISQTYGTAQWSGDNVPSIGDVFGNPSYSGVVHTTWAINPNLLNELAFNYNGNRINIVPTGVYARPAGLSIPELFPGNNLDRNPAIDLSGSTGTDYEPSSWPWHNKADDYQIRDDLSWTRGSHQLKFGASWALYKKIQDLFGDTEGSFVFNGNYTGNDFADFLLGYANSYTELAVQDAGHWDNISPAAYVADNWRVTPRLTLNLGLRWDGIPHTYEENNRQSNFYPNLYNPSNAAILTSSGTIAPNSPGLGTSPNPILNGYQFYLNGIGIAGQNGIPRGLVDDQWLNFGPRIGFAYDVFGDAKTVVRGGFGIMYERLQGNDVYNAGPNIPFSSSVTLNNVSLSSPNTSLLTGQTITAPITAASITGISKTDYKAPVSDQYSFGIQHQLWTDSVLSVEYVGNVNRHQNDYRNINLPNPSVLPALIQGTTNYNNVVPYAGFGEINVSENAENSHYNSLQVDFRSRLRKDLNLQIAYTWAKAIDPGLGSGDLSNVSNPYNRNYDYGPMAFDRTHVFVANFVYNLPPFTNTNKFVRSTIGSWQLSGVVTAETGLPLNITLSGPQGPNGIPGSTNRPNVIGSPSNPQTVNEWFDTAIFALPALGQWGDAGKGDIRGPGRQNWNIALFKEFVLSETRGSRFELRLETFNTFNHTQFHNVSTAFGSSNFGAVTSTWDPRTLQLGAKLYF